MTAAAAAVSAEGTRGLAAVCPGCSRPPSERDWAERRKAPSGTGRRFAEILRQLTVEGFLGTPATETTACSPLWRARRRDYCAGPALKKQPRRRRRLQRQRTGTSRGTAGGAAYQGKETLPTEPFRRRPCTTEWASGGGQAVGARLGFQPATAWLTAASSWQVVRFLAES